MRSTTYLLLAFTALVHAGCASPTQQHATAQLTQTRPVDPAQDNRAVVDQLSAGLVMRIDIHGGTVALHDVELMLVPRYVASDDSGERVLISGWRGKQMITAISIADQRINIQEGVGRVILERRSLTAALPLSTRIDTVEVSLPGATQPQRFSVTELFDRICREQARSEVCR